MVIGHCQLALFRSIFETLNVLISALKNILTKDVSEITPSLLPV